MATEAPSHQPSGKLRHWLQKLQTAKKSVSQASRVRGFGGVSHCAAAQGLLHPISGANPHLLPTAGDPWLPGGLRHPPSLPSAERPAVHSPPGAMHLAPAGSVGSMARHGTHRLQRVPQGLGKMMFIASLDCISYLSSFLIYMNSGSNLGFLQSFKLLGFIVYL